MDALADHEVVKFIGRDCRALEAGYTHLLHFLCEGSEVYVQKLKARHNLLLRRQEAAGDALHNLEEQMDDELEVTSDRTANSPELMSEEERIASHLTSVESELVRVTSQLLEASNGVHPPPMCEKVRFVVGGDCLSVDRLFLFLFYRLGTQFKVTMGFVHECNGNFEKNASNFR